MAKPIDTKNEAQMKKQKVVAIIHGADKVEYTITEKHPLVVGDKKGNGKDKRANVGDKHWSHPSLVEKWGKLGWVEKTDAAPVVNKMPEVQE